MKIPSSVLTLLIGIFITLASLWYGQNHGLMPVAASSEAELVDGLFNTMMTIGFGLFLLVAGAIVFAAISFRRREGDEGDGEHIEGNIPLEIVWTAIPAVVVLGISIYSFDIYTRMGGLDLMDHNHSMAPAQQLAQSSANRSSADRSSADRSSAGRSVQVAYAPNVGDQPLLTAEAGAGMGLMPDMEDDNVLSIDVKGLQYAFIFNYSNGIVDGELHVPVNQPVELNLNAQDVLHAFWLPEFRIKQDMIPGQDTKLVFNAIREGTYPVVCAELCGPYHGGMRTQIIVESPENYTAWVDSRLTAMAAGDRTIANLPKAPSDRTEAEYLNNFVEPMQLAVAPESLAELHSHHFAQ
ncbi:MAG: cytochrome c oxidase subunit II [Phormidesmis sp.]